MRAGVPAVQRSILHSSVRTRGDFPQEPTQTLSALKDRDQIPRRVRRGIFVWRPGSTRPLQIHAPNPEPPQAHASSIDPRFSQFRGTPGQRTKLQQPRIPKRTNKWQETPQTRPIWGVSSQCRALIEAILYFETTETSKFDQGYPDFCIFLIIRTWGVLTSLDEPNARPLPGALTQADAHFSSSTGPTHQPNTRLTLTTLPFVH